MGVPAAKEGVREHKAHPVLGEDDFRKYLALTLDFPCFKITQPVADLWTPSVSGRSPNLRGIPREADLSRDQLDLLFC